MHKKIFSLLLAFVFVALAVGFVRGPVHAQTTINYASYQSDPKPRAYTESIVKLWNDRNPDNQVTLNVTEHEAFKQAIRTQLVASPSPDVLDWFAGNRARFFIDKGLIADISDVWQSEGWDKVYPAGFKALGTVNDKQYFLSNNYYWWALYFRPSILAANKLEAPKTWDDLLNVCDKLNAAGVTPITIGTQAPWTAAAWFDYINMRLNGPEFHIDLMLLKEKYTDPRVKAVFMKWKELFDHKCFIADSAALKWEDAVTPLVQGKAAMYLMGQFIADTYGPASEGTDAAKDLDFVRFPIIDPAQKIGEDAPTDGVFLGANGANLEAAKKYLAWIGSKEVVQMGVEQMGRLPVRNDIPQDLFTDVQKQGIALIQSADYVAQFYDRDTTPEMAEVGLNAFASFFIDQSEANIDAQLATMEETRARLAEEAANQ